MLLRYLSVFGLCLPFSGAVPAAADDAHIYNGITLDEFVAFAEGEGWEVRVESEQMAAVSVRLENASAYILMFDCDEARRCRSGVIQEISYYFVEPTQSFWHWNLGNHGATGYGPNYVTLQRYLHFSGVTDRYLREVIGGIWPEASQAFWTMVEEMTATNEDGDDGQ